MAGEIVRPSALPSRGNPVASEVVPSDNGSSVGGVTWEKGVAAGRPLASQAEAEAGVNATKAMTPLTTKQAIYGLGDERFASAAQGDTADTAVQPGDLADVATSGSYLDLSDKPTLSDETSAQSLAYAAENLHPVSAPSFIRTAGYAAPGDGGGALYKLVASEPSHAGKLSITLADGVTVVWYEIAETVLRPEMLGAVSGTASNQQAALQAMFSVGSPEVYLPAGNWRSDSDLTRTTDIVIRGPGTLDFSNSASAQLAISGTLEVIDPLSINVPKHARTLVWASPQGFSGGDIVVLWNPTDFSWGSRRAEYRDGAMFRVHTVTGNTVLTYDMAVDAYIAANFNVYKMTPVKAIIDGITLKPCITAQKAPLRLYRCADSIIRGVRSLQGGDYGGIQVDQCYNTSYEDVSPLNNSPHVNNEYGIIISNSHIVSVRGAGAFATRHAVTVGGSGGEASIPNRFINISGMTLVGFSHETAVADIHGNSDFVTYDNCMLIGGAGMSGRHPTLRNCMIFGESAALLTSRKGIYSAEIAGGIYTIENCTILTTGDGNSEGFIQLMPLGPGGGGVAEANMRENMTLIIRNVTIEAPNAHANAKAVRILSSNANKSINVQIDGLTVLAPNLIAFLVAGDTVLSAFPSNFLMVDNVYGPSGAYLVYPDAKLAAVPTREMTQRGSQALTTTAVVSNAAASQNFRYKYSKMPSAVVGVSLASGASSGPTAGQPASPKVYELSATAIRCSIVAPAAFTAGTDVLLHWEAGVGGV